MRSRLTPRGRAAAWLAALILTAVVGNICTARMELSPAGLAQIALGFLHLGWIFAQGPLLGLAAGLAARTLCEVLATLTVLLVLATSMAVGSSLNGPSSMYSCLGLLVMPSTAFAISGLGGLALRQSGWRVVRPYASAPSHRWTLRGLLCWMAVLAVIFAIWGALLRPLAGTLPGGGAKEMWVIVLGTSITGLVSFAITTPVSLFALGARSDISRWARPARLGAVLILAGGLLLLLVLLAASMAAPNLVMPVLLMTTSASLTAWLAGGVLHHVGFRVVRDGAEPSPTEELGGRRRAGWAWGGVLLLAGALFAADAWSLQRERQAARRLSAFHRAGLRVFESSRVDPGALPQKRLMGLVYRGDPWNERARDLLTRTRIGLLHVRAPGFPVENLELLVDHPIDSVAFDPGCFDDKYLPVLARMQSLRTLQLGNVNRNTPAMQEFMAARPDCHLPSPLPAGAVITAPAPAKTVRSP